MLRQKNANGEVGAILPRKTIKLERYLIATI